VRPSAAALARRLGAVVTVVLTRVVSVLFFVAMVLSPTWLLASTFYLLRVVVGSPGNPVRQSFVMGLSEERSRSTVAAFGNLPSQLTPAVAPSLGAYMMTAISFEAPLLMAAAVQLVNAGTFLLAFRGMRPPEEEPAATAAAAPVRP
jgi:predicted MFS family arabinose efflux permease